MNTIVRVALGTAVAGPLLWVGLAGAVEEENKSLILDEMEDGVVAMGFAAPPG